MAHTQTFQTPHLKTALTGPLQLLEKQILSQQHEIEQWFNAQWRLSPAPAYGSVDLRNAGFKLAPVDMNLFPAGFNNLRLNPDFTKLSVAAARQVILQLMPDAKNILLVPESHTRNIFYWENVQALMEVITGAGFPVRVGSLSPNIKKPQDYTLKNGQKLLIEPAIRTNDKLSVQGFNADLVILNNDLSEGIPEILQGLKQIVAPPAELGWSLRLKSEHFQYYAQVCEEFAKLIQIDPW